MCFVVCTCPVLVGLVCEQLVAAVVSLVNRACHVVSVPLPLPVSASKPASESASESASKRAVRPILLVTLVRASHLATKPLTLPPVALLLLALSLLALLFPALAPCNKHHRPTRQHANQGWVINYKPIIWCDWQSIVINHNPITITNFLSLSNHIQITIILKIKVKKVITKWLPNDWLYCLLDKKKFSVIVAKKSSKVLVINVKMLI